MQSNNIWLCQTPIWLKWHFQKCTFLCRPFSLSNLNSNLKINFYANSRCMMMSRIELNLKTDVKHKKIERNFQIYHNFCLVCMNGELLINDELNYTHIQKQHFNWIIRLSFFPESFFQKQKRSERNRWVSKWGMFCT